MSHSNKCDVCGKLNEDGIFLQYIELSSNDKMWSDIDICRSCFNKPLSEILVASCPNFVEAIDAAPPEKDGLYQNCSFCGADRSNAELIISNKNVGICAECADTCTEILEEKRESKPIDVTIDIEK